MYRNCLTGLTLVAMMTGALPVLAQESATKRVVIDTTAGAANAPQTPTCGRRGTAAWMGGEAAASVISGAAAPFGQTISISGSDETIVLFRVENEATTVRVEVNADEAPTGDPVLRLFNSAGGLIDESDDYGSSLNSRIEANLEPGDYCASIASVGSDGFDAKVQIGLEAHPAIVSEGAASGIAACTATTEARPLTEGALDQALPKGAIKLNAAGDATSYLRFSLSEATSLTLRANSTTLDPKVSLFDARGELVAENDDSDGNTNARLDFPNTLAAGDYCLGVISLQSGAGQIEVSAEALDRAAYLMSAYKRGELIPSAESGYKIEPLDLAAKEPTVSLLSKDAIWYAFDLKEETVIVVTAYGKLAGADTKLALFDHRGQPVTENDDSDGSTDARLGPVVLAPGSYRMALTDIGENAAGSARPTLISVDRFLRAQ